MRSTCRLFAAAAVAVTLVTSSAVHPASARVPDGTKGRVAGVAFMSQAQPLAALTADIPRVRSLGANLVGLDVWQYIPGKASNDIVALPGLTASDEELAQFIRAARLQGMRVMFTVKLGLLGTEAEWRGYYDPPNAQRFFENYQRVVAHYAELAQRTGVWLFVVGSEYDQAQRYEGWWRSIIATARSRFRGLMTYEVNRSTINRGHTVAFWDALDLVAVSAYFPLSDKARPTVAELEAGWRNYKGQRHLDDLRALAKATGKKILFGEAGYLASTYVGREPWSASIPDGTYAPELQAAAYQAMLNTFDNEPWWAGMVAWSWDRLREIRSIHDKPVERLLQQWWRDGLRPGDPGFVPGGTPFTTTERVTWPASQTATQVAALARGRAARTEATPPTAGAPHALALTDGAAPAASAPSAVGSASGPTTHAGATATRPGRRRDAVDVTATLSSNVRPAGRAVPLASGAAVALFVAAAACTAAAARRRGT